MSVESFKKSIWEDALITEFRNTTVADLITTKPSKVEGKKAIFNRLSGGTIKKYEGKVVYDTVDTQPIELVYDQENYFAITLDDVDAVQSSPSLLQETAKEKALDMDETQDQIIFTEILANVPASNTIGSKTKKKVLSTPEEFYDAVVDLGIKLSKKKTPKSQRYILASCEFVQQMAKDKRFADNYNVLPNGILEGANVNGMTIIENEDVPANTVIAVHKSATGYGMELDKTEALRLESAFADAVRGLQVSGAKTLREKASAVLYWDFPTVTE